MITSLPNSCFAEVNRKRRAKISRAINKPIIPKTAAVRNIALREDRLRSGAYSGPPCCAISLFHCSTIQTKNMGSADINRAMLAASHHIALGFLSQSAKDHDLASSRTLHVLIRAFESHVF